MSPDNSSPSTTVRRTLGNTPPTDVGRGTIRISKSDAEQLGATFGSILEIKTENGSKGYAKCYFIQPDEETSYSGQVQLDSIIQRSLSGMNAMDFRMPVSITKFAAEKPDLATSVTVEQIPMVEDSTTTISSEKSTTLDSHWLVLMLEDKLLWKGALVVVPNQGVMSLFRVVSVDPAPVALGTALTKIKVQGKDDEEPVKTQTISSLFGYNLNIQFKKGFSNFDKLSEALVKKGFTREDKPRGVGLMVPAGVDSDLMRIPSRESMRLPHPMLHKGSIMLLDTGEGFMVGHFRGIRAPFERSEEFIRDFEQELPLIQEALESELGLNLHDDSNSFIESMTFEAFYQVNTGTDSRPVLRSLSILPDVPELGQFVGRKEGNAKLILYPQTRDRSLQPKGLVQITIGAMNMIGGTAGYDVRFSYGLVDLLSAIRLIHSSARNAVSIIRALEEDVSQS